MLLTAIQTGVRVSELVNLTIANLSLGTGSVASTQTRRPPCRLPAVSKWSWLPRS